MTLQRRSGGDRAWTKGRSIRYAVTICSRGVYRAFPAVCRALCGLSCRSPSKKKKDLHSLSFYLQ